MFISKVFLHVMQPFKTQKSAIDILIDYWGLHFVNLLKINVPVFSDTNLDQNLRLNSYI